RNAWAQAGERSWLDVAGGDVCQGRRRNRDLARAKDTTLAGDCDEWIRCEWGWTRDDRTRPKRVDQRYQRAFAMPTDHRVWGRRLLQCRKFGGRWSRPLSPRRSTCLEQRDEIGDAVAIDVGDRAARLTGIRVEVFDEIDSIVEVPVQLPANQHAVFEVLL